MISFRVVWTAMGDRRPHAWSMQKGNNFIKENLLGGSHNSRNYLLGAFALGMVGVVLEGIGLSIAALGLGEVGMLYAVGRCSDKVLHVIGFVEVAVGAVMEQVRRAATIRTDDRRTVHERFEGNHTIGLAAGRHDESVDCPIKNTHVIAEWSDMDGGLHAESGGTGGEHIGVVFIRAEGGFTDDEQMHLRIPCPECGQRFDEKFLSFDWVEATDNSNNECILRNCKHGAAFLFAQRKMYVCLDVNAEWYDVDSVRREVGALGNFTSETLQRCDPCVELFVAEGVKRVAFIHADAHLLQVDCFDGALSESSDHFDIRRHAYIAIGEDPEDIALVVRE